MKRFLSLALCFCLILSLCACGQNEAAPTWQEQYDLGIRYLSEGNYEEAIIAFTAAIKIDPKRTEGYLSLAEAYVATGDTGAAQKTLQDALALVDDPTELEAKLAELSGDTANVAADEQYLFALETGTDGSINVDADYLTVHTIDSRTASITISGLSLQNSYPVNLETNQENDGEYLWEVAMHGPQGGYSVSTAWWCWGDPGEMSPGEMQHSVWVLEEDGCGSYIADAEMQYTADSITWNFTIPAEYPFDFAQVERYMISVACDPTAQYFSRLYTLD